MPDTAFYAWQSDHPAKANKNFIRDAIDRAIEAVNPELAVEDALRADQDTQGVSGDINVAEVIFEKIDLCKIFVADVTTITPRSASRPSPNPNVLVEYGRASVRPGSACIVTVFNEAFGNWETDRPFDLRHRRRPILYTLPAAHSQEERTAARKVLVSQLVIAFKTILETRPASISPQLPSAMDFNQLREDYIRTPLGGAPRGKILGFWCGLIPVSQQIQIDSPWEKIDLAQRHLSFTFRRGSGTQRFETIDTRNDNCKPKVEPFKGGARFLFEHRFRCGHQEWFDDAVAVYLYGDGKIALAVRTNCFEPMPHLNRRWIMSDIANSVAIMDRVRVGSKKPSCKYALFAELRYDIQTGASCEPTGASWRLGTLEDDSGQTGTLVSTTVDIGPISVGPKEKFSEVLKSVYADLVTSVGRTPEPELNFEQIA